MLVGVPTGVWPLTVAGATAVSGAVLWHGIQLWRRLRRALPGRFRVTVRYYLAAARASRSAPPSAPGWRAAWTTSATGRCSSHTRW